MSLWYDDQRLAAAETVENDGVELTSTNPETEELRNEVERIWGPDALKQWEKGVFHGS